MVDPTLRPLFAALFALEHHASENPSPMHADAARAIDAVANALESGDEKSLSAMGVALQRVAPSPTDPFEARATDEAWVLVDTYPQAFEYRPDRPLGEVAPEVALELLGAIDLGSPRLAARLEKCGEEHLHVIAGAIVEQLAGVDQKQWGSSTNAQAVVRATLRKLGWKGPPKVNDLLDRDRKTRRMPND